MINLIIDGICNALHTEFGDNYKIHTESIKQGLTEPCFFVSCINPTNELFLGKRYFRQNKFAIQYFPSTDEKKIECNAVLERLYDCLEYITVDTNQQMGTKMKAETVDDVLNFFVNYDMFVYKISNEEPDTMDELQQSGTEMKG